MRENLPPGYCFCFDKNTKRGLTSAVLTAHVQYELVHVHVTEPVSGFYYGWLSSFLPLSLVSVSGPLKASRLSEIIGAGAP